VILLLGAWILDIHTTVWVSSTSCRAEVLRLVIRPVTLGLSVAVTSLMWMAALCWEVLSTCWSTGTCSSLYEMLVKGTNSSYSTVTGLSRKWQLGILVAFLVLYECRGILSSAAQMWSWLCGWLVSKTFYGVVKVVLFLLTPITWTAEKLADLIFGVFKFWSVFGEVWRWFLLKDSKMKIVEDNGVDELSEKEMLRRIMLSVGTKEVRKESMVVGSPVIGLDQWPREVCALKNAQGRHVGFGSFVVLKGKWCVLTAAHVLKECRGGSLWTPSGQFSILDTSRLVLRSSMDVVAFEVNNDVASKLGCKKMKMARTPAAGSVISLHGYVDGKLVLTKGNVTGLAGKMKFKHSSSTLPGFCGSPVITGDSTIVGIHIESDGLGYNYALSLDFVLVNQESEQADRHLFGQFEEMDETDLDYEREWFDFDQHEADLYASRKHWKAVERQEEVEAQNWRTVADMDGWADDLDELEDIEETRRWNISSRKQKEKADFGKGSGEKPTTSTTTTSGCGTTGPTKAQRKRLRKKSQKDASGTLANSDVGLAEAEKETTDRALKKSSATPPSKGGDGQRETGAQQLGPSGSMDATVGSGKNPQRQKGKQSSKPSYQQGNTPSLPFQKSSEDRIKDRIATLQVALAKCAKL